MKELTHIEVKGNKIIAHYTRVIDNLVWTPENRPDLIQYWNAGYVKIIKGFGGVHSALKNDGTWEQIDFLKEIPTSKSTDPFLNDGWIASHVVPECGWGEWVKTIPIKRIPET